VIDGQHGMDDVDSHVLQAELAPQSRVGIVNLLWRRTVCNEREEHCVTIHQSPSRERGRQRILVELPPLSVVRRRRIAAATGVGQGLWLKLERVKIVD